MERTILLVEDDDAIAEVVGLHMADAGFRVRRAADGRTALQAVDRENIDLVLLDLMLPDVDGLDVCRLVRARPAYLPIIIISARASETHRVLGLELGADDYVPKPFSALELVARARAFFRRMDRQQTPMPAQAMLRFGDHTLDMERRTLERHGIEVSLTLREFDLLAFLVRHPGRVFSRGELLARVWGTGFDGYDHTVNSHINRLRAKLEPDPHHPVHLETVWGVGYRFRTRPRPP